MNISLWVFPFHKIIVLGEKQEKLRLWWNLAKKAVYGEAATASQTKLASNLILANFLSKGVDFGRSGSKNIEAYTRVWVKTMLTKWCFDAFATHHPLTVLICHNSRK